MTTFGRGEMLAVVERSPAAAGAHDRDSWVQLFTPDGVVNDPVGSRPHVGRKEIERFYDTFIGPRNITFHCGGDVVAGSSVIRDVELEIEMSSRVTMRVPVLIRYDLRFDSGELRVERLAAYWELPGMVAQFLRSGIAAAPVSMWLTVALLKNQGPRGTVGFGRGFGRVGDRAKATTSNFLEALSSGDVAGASRHLHPDAALTVAGEGSVGLGDLASRMLGSRSRKYLAAGNFVAVGLGYQTGRGHSDGNGFGVFEFDTNRGSITGIEWFLE